MEAADRRLSGGDFPLKWTRVEVYLTICIETASAKARRTNNVASNEYGLTNYALLTAEPPPSLHYQLLTVETYPPSTFLVCVGDHMAYKALHSLCGGPLT